MNWNRDLNFGPFDGVPATGALHFGEVGVVPQRRCSSGAVFRQVHASDGGGAPTPASAVRGRERDCLNGNGMEDYQTFKRVVVTLVSVPVLCVFTNWPWSHKQMVIIACAKLVLYCHISVAFSFVYIYLFIYITLIISTNTSFSISLSKSTIYCTRV